MKYEKCCRNCEHAYLASCKGCDTLGSNTYQNFELRHDLTKPLTNRPLTIEELKALEVGDWVWMVYTPSGNGHYDMIEEQGEEAVLMHDDGYRFAYKYEDYGKLWLAYKNKEQAEAKGEIVELPCFEPFSTFNIETGEPCTAYNVLYRDKVSGELVIDCEDDEPHAEARLKELRGEK